MESLGTRLRYLPGDQNVAADFISRNNISDTNKCITIQCVRIESS